MKHRVLALLFAAALIGPIGTGMAFADTLPQVKVTSDKYRLTLSINDINIQSVPNMAAAPLVREGYVTATSTLGVACIESPCPAKIIASWLSLSAQVGCPMDLSKGIEINPNSTIAAGIPPGLALSQLLPNDPTGLTNIAIAPTVSSGIGALEVAMGPGSITDVKLGSLSFPAGKEELAPLEGAATLAEQVKKYIDQVDPSNKTSVEQGVVDVGSRITNVLNRKAEDGLVVSLQNRHIVVQRSTDPTAPDSACGGPVAIRLYANAVVTTKTSSEKISVYSDILNL